MQFLQVLVVADLHLVAQVDDLLKEGKVVHVVARGILDAAVQVDGQHALGARGHATGAESVAEAVVLDFVAEAAARRQGVGVVAEVGEEGVSFGVHLGGEIAPFLVDDVAVFREQRHRFHREGEHASQTLRIKPLHEAFLEPAQRLPVGL